MIGADRRGSLPRSNTPSNECIVSGTSDDGREVLVREGNKASLRDAAYQSVTIPSVSIKATV